MIHDTAENIIRLAAAHVATGTPADRVCIVLPTGTRWSAYDEDLRAAGLATAAIATPDTDAQRENAAKHERNSQSFARVTNNR